MQDMRAYSLVVRQKSAVFNWFALYARQTLTRSFCPPSGSFLEPSFDPVTYFLKPRSTHELEVHWPWEGNIILFRLPIRVEKTVDNASRAKYRTRVFRHMWADLLPGRLGLATARKLFLKSHYPASLTDSATAFPSRAHGAAL